MNPLDLRGPDFIQLYFILGAVAVVASLVLQRVLLRTPGGEPEPPALELEPYEVAFLSGRELRAVDAALGALVHKGVLEVDPATGRLTRRGDLPEGRVPPLERLLLDRLCGGEYVRSFRKAVCEEARPLRRRLERLQLVLSQDRFSRSRRVPFLLLGALMALGIAKVMVGLYRNRPVGFLMDLLLTTLVVMVFLIIRAPHRTLLGDRALRVMAGGNEALRVTAAADQEQLAANDLVLAVGLYGLAMLPATLRRAINPPSTSGSGGSCSSGCSGSSCSSGCGGGGGCGGCGS